MVNLKSYLTLIIASVINLLVFLMTFSSLYLVIIYMVLILVQSYLVIKGDDFLRERMSLPLIAFFIVALPELWVLGGAVSNLIKPPSGPEVWETILMAQLIVAAGWFLSFRTMKHLLDLEQGNS